MIVELLFLKLSWMNLWNKLTKAKVTRTENELEISSLSQFPLWFNLLIILPLFLYYSLSFMTHEMLIPSMIFLLITVLFSSAYFDFNTGKISIINNHINVILEQGRDSKKIKLEAPFYIDLIVQSKNERIKIELYDKNEFIGHFTLKNELDLTKIIDGFTELLDLELIESRKLLKGEVLSFKSKKLMLSAYSDIQIKTIPNQLIFISKTNLSKWTKFHFNENRVEYYGRNLDFTGINKFLIKPNKRKIKLEALLNNGKRVELFRYKTTEISIIRDTNLMLKTLENRQELQGIEVELIEKS